MATPPNEQSIFLRAIELQSAADREAYLGDACRDNPALRAELDALLAAHDRLGQEASSSDSAPGSGVQDPPGQTSKSATDSEPKELLAGRYQLLEKLGEGGMGVVWMARQVEPVQRLVAVKLIKAGMDSQQVLARFELERQALALMDHPHIAKVFDAGASADGRPFFVMELVQGTPITQFCDVRQLPPRQRLELFVPVCHAIQHAHAKGVIHRDIKPSNILVALHDGKPVPKVIDFGVAKAAGEQLSQKTLNTGLGSVVGTVEYMSPEQAGLNPSDVDTRSDIYSLGVLLYELLTGSPPFTRAELEKAGVLEMLRVIREQEPSRPSTKLSTSEGLPTLAANRGTEPARLMKLVRGELDWIVMRALEKDRNRRYETANSLALDVQRYLADEPVEACPPSARYRLAKFVRRHRAQVSAACILLLALIGGIVGTSAGLIEANQQRVLADAEKLAAVGERETAQRQERVARKSLETLYSVAATHDPLEQFFPGQLGAARPSSDMTSAALAKARKDLAGLLHDQPRERARMNMVLGNVLRSRGQWRDAMPLLEDAARTMANLPDATALEKANAHYYLGWAQRDIGDLRDAERSLRECLRLLPAGDENRERIADAHFQLAWTWADLATIAAPDKKGHLRNDAIGALKKAEAGYNHPSVEDAAVRSALCQFAMIAIQGDYRKVNLAFMLAQLPARNDLPEAVFAVIAGDQARHDRNYKEAIAQFTIAEQSARRIFGPSHPLRVMTLALLADTHGKAGDRATGERLVREVLDISRKKWPHHPRLVEVLRELARSLVESEENPAEALRLIDEAEQIIERQGDDLAHARPDLAALRKRAEKQLLKK